MALSKAANLHLYFSAVPYVHDSVYLCLQY